MGFFSDALKIINPVGLIANKGIADSVFGSKNADGSVNYNNMPEMPVFTNEDGTLKDQYETAGKTSWQQLQAQNNLGKLQGMADTEGPTSLAQGQLDQNRLSSRRNLMNQTKQNQSSLASNMSNMSRFGGLGGASSERLAQQNMRNNNASSLATRGQELDNEMTILNQDNARKVDLQKSLANSYQNQAAYDDSKLDRDIQRSTGFQQNSWQEMMKAWAAKNSASELQAANKPSGLLGLGIAGVL
jgi:hypothetical protein